MAFDPRISKKTVVEYVHDLANDLGFSGHQALLRTLGVDPKLLAPSRGTRPDDLAKKVLTILSRDNLEQLRKDRLISIYAIERDYLWPITLIAEPTYLQPKQQAIHSDIINGDLEKAIADFDEDPLSPDKGERLNECLGEIEHIFSKNPSEFLAYAFYRAAWRLNEHWSYLGKRGKPFVEISKQRLGEVTLFDPSVILERAHFLNTVALRQRHTWSKRIVATSNPAMVEMLSSEIQITISEHRRVVEYLDNLAAVTSKSLKQRIHMLKAQALRDMAHPLLMNSILRNDCAYRLEALARLDDSAKLLNWGRTDEFAFREWVLTAATRIEILSAGREPDQASREWEKLYKRLGRAKRIINRDISTDITSKLDMTELIITAGYIAVSRNKSTKERAKYRLKDKSEKFNERHTFYKDRCNRTVEAIARVDDENTDRICDSFVK